MNLKPQQTFFNFLLFPFSLAGINIRASEMFWDISARALPQAARLPGRRCHYVAESCWSKSAFARLAGLLIKFFFLRFVDVHVSYVMVQTASDSFALNLSEFATLWDVPLWPLDCFTVIFLKRCKKLLRFNCRFKVSQLESTEHAKSFLSVWLPLLISLLRNSELKIILPLAREQSDFSPLPSLNHLEKATFVMAKRRKNQNHFRLLFR